MNAEAKEILRNEILRIAQVIAPCGVTLRLLESHLRYLQLGQSQRDTEVELHYLTGKGLLTPVAKAISPENRAWAITAEGTDHLAIAGLI